MTIKEAYEKLGGDYKELMHRVSESMLPLLIGMLLKDTNYEDLCAALERRDYEAAFRGAHTLKGVALNLSLMSLAEKASALTEALRSRQDNAAIEPAFLELKQVYLNIRTAFSKLLDSPSAGGDRQ